ncbi:hypothetical protein HMPREF9334_00487 [Selenomonas infelix ATCC 43532]|uniref:Uncharacterized protein n=1 Tax=Selenomonas infelix ATCC 43532 TaxID=679201 RepID=G5GMK6_9FIRM|nr:hypothetical protein [Selenomonas infelix]EHG21784.1 hypothetical protein HMPREF9334_00487 [Selenomonas infelix ATCC 43532]
MAELLHIYMNNPTEGAKDGTEVSSGTELAPISVLLDAGKSEQKAVKCAVRCESGFHIDGALTIKFVGDHADKWKAALNNGYTAETALNSAEWKDEIALSGVGAVNVIFWVKAMSSSDEKPQQDTSVDIQVEGLLATT